MAYQSFPWARGDSASYEKLTALQIPNLKGKSFLDVGCNEGFFCGYAEFIGADHVTGIDINPNFLAFAKALFPNCNFICQSWDTLGDTQYDVILNASAIHYAADQKKLIDELVKRLKPNGTLILEIGVAPGDKNEFVAVKRSIDTRFFPTQAKLLEMLDDYAWKYISHSVPQGGDPVPRYVYHISRKLPFAILALDNPHAGKTFTAKKIFRHDIRRISGDYLYLDVVNGERTAPDAIQKIIMEHRKQRDWGFITTLICKYNLFDELCSWLDEIAMHQDFILDMFIPSPFRAAMAEFMESKGYYVVNIQLQKAISMPRMQEKPIQNGPLQYQRHLYKEFMINEEEYLAANPDVAQALAEGKITGALAHYIFHGRQEGRKRSLKNESEQD